MSENEVLEIPFFSLEYNERKACFLRKIPGHAKDLGNGCFSYNGKIFNLPSSEKNKPLLQYEIKGKELLSLIRRANNPLIKSGPEMAFHEDRLMEMELLADTGILNEVRLTLRMGKIHKEKWMPLSGLPNHRLFENRIYEIMPEEVMALFTAAGDELEGMTHSLLLRGEEIPAFADEHARLIYVFADKALYKLLGQDNIFARKEDLSLVIRSENAMAYPSLKHEDKYYSAYKLSMHFHRKYFPLKSSWLRREELEALGMGPLGAMINGESLAPYPKKNIVESTIIESVQEDISFKIDHDAGKGYFSTEAKFQNLPASNYSAEQKEFSLECDYVNPQFIPLEEFTDYDALKKIQKDYFIFWRNEFRKGRTRETSCAYILLYTRELFLRMDTEASAEKTGEELLRLQEAYKDIYPQAFELYSEWLLDFAVINEVIIDTSLYIKLFEAHAQKNTGHIDTSLEKKHRLLLDLYIHKKYIEDNNNMQALDFIPILTQESGVPRIDNQRFEELLNNIDIFLRKNYGKKLLEIFFPHPLLKETFTCFRGLPGMGYSSYTAQWPSFCSHKPFTKVLSSIDEFYNRLLLLDIPDQKLEAEKIKRLREESDAVMEMLKIDKYEENFEISELRSPGPEKILHDSSKKPVKTSFSMQRFIENLDGVSINCLDLISRNLSDEAENIARSNNTMLEFIIDEINRQFIEGKGDILIESSLDQRPQIQGEYKDEVLWALTFRNA